MGCCGGGNRTYIQLPANTDSNSHLKPTDRRPLTPIFLFLQCPFCAIKLKSKEVLVATDQCFIIKDKKPKAIIHLLVVPRQHVQGLDDQLLSLELLEDMYSLALATLEGMYPAGSFKLGFRPADSHGHLHLHAFVLPHKPWWRRWRYKGETWVPVETVLEGLRARQQQLRSSDSNNTKDDGGEIKG